MATKTNLTVVKKGHAMIGDELDCFISLSMRIEKSFLFYLYLIIIYYYENNIFWPLIYRYLSNSKFRLSQKARESPINILSLSK